MLTPHTHTAPCASTAALCASPADTCSKATSTSACSPTRIGVLLSSSRPKFTPSSFLAADPHAYSLPVRVRARLCSDPQATDLMALVLSPANSTCTNSGMFVLLPMPSCPAAFAPRAYTRPELVTTSTWASPHAMCTILSPSNAAGKCSMDSGCASRPRNQAGGTLSPCVSTDPSLKATAQQNAPTDTCTGRAVPQAGSKRTGVNVAWSVLVSLTR